MCVCVCAPCTGASKHSAIFDEIFQWYTTLSSSLNKSQIDAAAGGLLRAGVVVVVKAHRASALPIVIYQVASAAGPNQ